MIDFDAAPDNRAEMLPRVREVLNDARSFLVTGHENVDGDSSGCEVALQRGLESLGKTVRVVNNEELMPRYAFLDPEGRCEVFEKKRFDAILEDTDVVIVVDNNSWPRLAALREPVTASGLPVVCLDHHRFLEPFSDLHLYDVNAAATGEIVYDLLLDAGAEIDPMCAQALHTTLCSDTGWFRYSNTTARTFEIAADLLRRGAVPDRINTEVNYRETPAMRRVLARVWEDTRLEFDGAFAWTWVSQATVRRHGIPMGETEGFIDRVRNMLGVKITAFMREQKSGGVRVSLRSRDECHCLDAARTLGGGGHLHAAGATLDCSLEQAKKIVPAAVRECWEKWNS